MEKEKEELLEDEEIDETEEETTTPRKGSLDSKKPVDFKKMVIDTVKGIIADYKELMKNSEDEILLKGFEDETRSEEECVNYIMNNLVKENIFCGKDSLMYPYIHDYYVDDLDKSLLLDNWSNNIRNTPAPSKGGAKAQAKEDAKNSITEEQKQKYYEEALEEAKREAKFKAEEDFKKAEAKRKEKEKARKEAEAKAKEEAKAKAKSEGAAEQMSLFDF